MFRFSSRRALAVLLACACCLVLLACQGAGDGGVTDTNDFLNRGVTVTPGTTSALTYVSILETAGDATTTCIGVKAFRVSNLFSAAFSVTYDPTVLRYTGFDATASCLGMGGNVLAPQVDAVTTPGRIVVGLTRNAAVTTTGIDNCGEMIDLCFDVIGEGTFQMNFTGNLALLEPDGDPVADLGTNWVGGELEVTQ